MAAEDERTYLPSCWSDDTKMTAYFSPCRTFTANLEGLASKINFWRTCIDTFCRTTKKLIFTIDEINKAFIRNGRVPQCLSTVMEDMSKSEDVIEFRAFMNIKPNNKSASTWSAWAWEFSKAPVSWAWTKAKSYVVASSSPKTDTKYVHKGAVQDTAEDILLKASDLRGQVVPLEVLMEKCSLPMAGADDALVAIHWLCCQNKCAVMNVDYSNPSKVLVKLATIDHKGHVSITDKDLCKYNLMQLIKKTEVKIEEYEARCELAREEARMLISKKSKVLALSQLKKKKMYEQIINKEANILNNIHSLLETLNETESNQEVIDALKTANATLKNTQREANLTEDTVLDVMDDVRETIETQEDINSAISQSIVPGEDDDIEKELASLQQDVATEDGLCKWVENLKLPDVPVSPASADIKSAKIEKI